MSGTDNGDRTIKVDVRGIVRALLHDPSNLAELPSGIEASTDWENGGPRYTIWLDDGGDSFMLEEGDLVLKGWADRNGQEIDWPGELRTYFDELGTYLGPDVAGRYPILEPKVEQAPNRQLQ